ncbi:18233_t:CDS:2 [Funneliformis geosporum]|uniref:18233_t:CDS:1 n=1 Tax=Funneliformis geosporum TaxID=1117311 RepID=A0A9W4SPQ0_9GLOM|nr:18233_t:CDS:2 [Funneliformis geosporum]
MNNEQESSPYNEFYYYEDEMYNESFLTTHQNNQQFTNITNQYEENDDNNDHVVHHNQLQTQSQQTPYMYDTKFLEYTDPLEVSSKRMDPKFINSESNLFNWTFVENSAPLYFDNMYDTADGCFSYAGLPAEYIFDFSQKY